MSASAAARHDQPGVAEATDPGVELARRSAGLDREPAGDQPRDRAEARRTRRRPRPRASGPGPPAWLRARRRGPPPARPRTAGRPRRPAPRRRTSRAGAAGQRAAARRPARPRRGPSRAEPWRSTRGRRPGTRHACQARRPRPAASATTHATDASTSRPTASTEIAAISSSRCGAAPSRSRATVPSVRSPAPAPARRSAATLMPPRARRLARHPGEQIGTGPGVDDDGRLDPCPPRLCHRPRDVVELAQVVRIGIEREPAADLDRAAGPGIGEVEPVGRAVHLEHGPRPGRLAEHDVPVEVQVVA